MSIHIEIDASEVRALHANISGAPARVQLGSARILRGPVARVMEREMRHDARGHGFLPHLPRAVRSHLVGPFTLEVGLGPRKGTQGSLAHIIVYGSVNNAPVYDHHAAYYRAKPRIAEAFGDMAEDAVLGGDG